MHARVILISFDSPYFVFVRLPLKTQKLYLCKENYTLPQVISTGISQIVTFSYETETKGKWATFRLKNKNSGQVNEPLGDSLGKRSEMSISCFLQGKLVKTQYCPATVSFLDT
jgi:hypothetical protein